MVVLPAPVWQLMLRVIFMGRPAPGGRSETVRRSSLLPAHPAGGFIGCMRSPVRMAARPTALWSSTPMAGSTAQPRAEAWAMACSSAYLLRETSCPVSLATGWRPCCTVSLAAAMVQIPVGAWCSTAQAISMEAPPWEAHITTVRSMNTPMAACRSCTLFPASPTTA